MSLWFEQKGYSDETQFRFKWQKLHKVTIWTCLKQSSSIKPCDHVINIERLIRLVLLHLLYTSISSASDTVFNFLSDDVLAHVCVWINLAHVLLHRLMSRTSELQQVATGNYVSST